MKGLIVIVSKLYEYANAYDYEWAVPEFDEPTGNSESERREWSESVPDSSEQLGTPFRRNKPNRMVGAD